MLIKWTCSNLHLQIFIFIFILFWSSHIDWPNINSFGTLGTPRLKAPCWTPSCKVETKVLPPFQFTYMRVELWANHMGLIWGAIGNILGTWGGEPFENLTNCGTKWKLHFPLFIPQFPQNINNVNEIIFILGYPCSHCFHYTTSFTFLISFFTKQYKGAPNPFFAT